MSNKPILLNLVISDTHCGSNVGLMPPEVYLDKGNVVTHGKNHHQAWLWENWQRVLKQVYAVVGKDPFALTINGDAIEGIHHKSSEVVATLWEEHLAIATEVFLPITKKASKTYVVKGTECHTMNLENTLAHRLGAETAKDKWLYEINGCLVDATHHITTTGRAHLESGQYSIAMANAARQSQRAGHRVPDVYLRGHRHVGGFFCDTHSMMAITGAWQFLTRYGHKVVPDSIPVSTMLLLDWRNKLHGELPTVHQFKAVPPQDQIDAI